MKTDFNANVYLTHWDWDEIDAILPTTFLNAFSRIKIYWLRLKLHRSLFPQVQLIIFQGSSIGSDNGLVPIRQQAIIWTNDDYFTDAYSMRHSASMS